jgi:hypothetical protein
VYALIFFIQDNRCNEEHLDQEHSQDSILVASMNGELKLISMNKTTVYSSDAFENWRGFILHHLEHEEKVRNNYSFFFFLCVTIIWLC